MQKEKNRCRKLNKALTERNLNDIGNKVMANKNKIAKIIILAGQSNAVGVGYKKHLTDHFSADKVKEYESGYKNVRISFYSHDFGSDGFVDTTTVLAEKTKATFGPEIGIAEKLTADFTNEKFYIVKYAIGGSTLYHDWLSPTSRAAEGDNDRGATRTGYCYDEFAALLKKSIRLLETGGYKPEIRAFCWMQGESDAIEQNDVDAYIKRFDTLIKDFENEFKAYLKDYILADGGISPFWKYYQEINALKAEYAKIGERRVYIDTVGEGLRTDREPTENPDLPHYDSDSLIKLGHLFEETIKSNLR